MRPWSLRKRKRCAHLRTVMTEPLQPASLPLQGSALIEASAGTGKTWTIAALVLRLVLGHGAVVQRPDRPLQPAEILVMTFTRAATRELSDRIRGRLAEAAQMFRGQAAVPVGDEFLTELLNAYPDAASRDTAAWRLEVAAQAMDEAAVHTLDAWCQKVLREHAFDSESALQSEVVPDGSALRLEAARDVWRQEVYPLDPTAMQAVRQLWNGPEDLAADAQLAAEKHLPAAAGATDLARVIEDSVAELRALKAGWGERVEQMEAWLLPIAGQPNSPFNKTKVTQDKLEAWFDALRDWADDPSLERPGLTESNLLRLTPRGLREARNKNQILATPPECFDDMELLIQALSQQRSREPAMRAFAAQRVEARLQTLKQQRLLHSHHDVQRLLHDALNEQQQGPRALRLRERILSRYPVALVDEFQDTSPLQLSILDRLYRIRDNDPARLLLLIGDPKQSIYAFRGADIHSYLSARQATLGRHYALDVNYRSSAAVVGAVNLLLQCAEQRPGDGAFRFGQRDGVRRLPFEPVRAKGRAEVLRQHQQAVPALTLCIDTELRSSTDARKAYAQRCAQAIVTLLSEGDSQFAAPGSPAEPLRPGDIAVLVRSHREATAIREALAARDLPSVFLSDRESVFQTAEAADLLRVLQAVAAPRDSSRVRAALATALLGKSLAELQHIAQDDEEFDRQAERLAQLLPVWQGQGVLAMVRVLLHSFGLPALWLAAPDGERRLTNLLHLGELLQAAAALQDGLAAQMGWLARQIETPLALASGHDDQVLRLESDADRVQVVTIHKSKGLEYPVVFLPFATQVRDSRRFKPWALWLVDDAGKRRVVLEPTAEDRAQALREEQREDLRLLYVALTRARHALWVGASVHTVGAAKANVWHQSALGYLVSGDQATDLADIALALQTLQAQAADGVRAPIIQLQSIDPVNDPALEAPKLWVPQHTPAALRAQSPYSAAFDRSWSISSYSSLVRDVAVTGVTSTPSVPHVEDHDLRLESEWLLDDEPLQSGDALPDFAAASVLVVGRDSADEPSSANVFESASAAGQPWHHFPRGAFAGNFLHQQLDWLAQEGFALQGNVRLETELKRRCERAGWGHRSADVQEWLAAVCERALPPWGEPLRAVNSHLSEMEFWLPSDGLDTRRLDNLCRQHLLPGQTRPELAPRSLHGLLMGFADLILEHQGRFWVLDYKSNYLGPQDADYQQAQMQRAVLEHRYDVQAALYLLPLHRLLRGRLGPRYDPQRMLGGAVFLFLRGIAAPGAGCLWLQAPQALLEGLDQMMSLTAAREGSS